MRLSLSLIIFTLFTLNTIAQGSSYELQKAESKLSALLTELRTVKEDAAIDKVNEQFKEEFKKALELDGAFDFAFTSLTTVGKIYSQDKLVRVISWNVQYEDLSHDYHSFILKKDERRGRVSVIELSRQKQNLYSIQYETIGQDNWYGALYYDIIDVQRRNRTYYTLLGYDPNDQRSTIKLIDVLYFTGNRPNFGSPIFDTKDSKVSRVIMEYSNEATMSLRYDKAREKIIFDHLSPESPTMKEFREFYVPDMSYDAYSWDGRQWELIEDIIAVNKSTSERINLKAYDAELDSVVSIPTKSKWINPEDASAPIDGGRHRAMTPEDLEKDSKDNKEKSKRKRAKKKKAPEGRSAIKPGSSRKKRRR